MNVTEEGKSSVHASIFTVAENMAMFQLGNAIIYINCPVAVVGNLLNIAAFIKCRQLRTISNYFLISLAVADLLMAFLAILEAVDFGPCEGFYVDLHVVFLFSTRIVSFVHLMLIAIDRYVAVNFPLHYGGDKMAPKTAIRLIALAWILTGATFSLQMLRYATVAEMNCDQIIDETFCDVVLVACYVVVMTAISIIYTNILMVIRRQQNAIQTIQRPPASGSSPSRSEPPPRVGNQEVRKKPIIILSLLILATFVTWTPFILLTIYKLMTIDAIYFEELLYVFRQMTLINNAVNLFVYAGVSKEYRAAYRMVIRCE